MSETIFKVCSREEWDQACAAGAYRGSEDDVRDGFIHFSRAHQLRGTLNKYFSGRQDLVLIAFAARELGETLRYEPSRGGDLFPHLYGELSTNLAKDVRALVWDSENGRFVGLDD